MRRLLLLCLGLLGACAARPAPDDGLSVAAITRHVRPDAPDREGWARDVREALRFAGQPVDADHVCQVLAIVEQESGYDPDPAVPGLSGVVDAQVDAELAALGPLRGPVRRAVLGDFEQRLAEVRTEQDLDRLYRNLVDARAAEVPALARAARVVAPRVIERHNPVETVGSMQVRVDWARAEAKARGLDPAPIRDELYTRPGGLRWGTARLFVHDAAYDDPIHRFADYNVGPYASRNAAFQAQLAELTDRPLALDGDLLAWDDRGRPSDGETMAALLAWRAERAPDLPEARVRRDARLEKTAAFEDTETWRRVRQDHAARTGRAPAYARVPAVTLDSPKLSRELTTAWFAERVDRRYGDCLARGR